MRGSNLHKVVFVWSIVVISMHFYGNLATNEFKYSTFVCQQANCQCVSAITIGGIGKVIPKLNIYPLPHSNTPNYVDYIIPTHAE